MSDVQRTHFADDDTLAYIAKLERELAEKEAALKTAQEEAERFYQLSGRYLERANKAEAENAALREDAERYRWLREPQEFICVDQDLDGNFRSLIRKELDAAIDKARRGE